jgi:hypothetical protein
MAKGTKMEVGYPRNKTHYDFLKLGTLFLAALYFLDIAFFYRDNWCFLDGMNLWIHEAGHFLFMLSGNDFLTILGGTILQLLMPLLFIWYFFTRGQRYSAALTTFWLGESLVNISVYMGDAVAMQLPLLGGSTEGHDWHNLLSMLDILSSAQQLSGMTRMLGALVILGALVAGAAYSRRHGDELDDFSGVITITDN